MVLSPSIFAADDATVFSAYKMTKLLSDVSYIRILNNFKSYIESELESEK